MAPRQQACSPSRRLCSFLGGFEGGGLAGAAGLGVRNESEKRTCLPQTLARQALRGVRFCNPHTPPPPAHAAATRQTLHLGAKPPRGNRQKPRQAHPWHTSCISPPTSSARD